jgi:hypothetical protein
MQRPTQHGEMASQQGRGLVTCNVLTKSGLQCQKVRHDFVLLQPFDTHAEVLVHLVSTVFSFVLSSLAIHLCFFISFLSFFFLSLFLTPKYVFILYFL